MDSIISRTESVVVHDSLRGKTFIGRLRPEQTIYEARVTHPVGGDPLRASAESGDSQRMIIKKGVEWSVNYDLPSRRVAPETGSEEYLPIQGSPPGLGRQAR
jgi:hypothetical protein